MTCNCIIGRQAYRGNPTARQCLWRPCWCHERGCPQRSEYLRLVGGRGRPCLASRRIRKLGPEATNGRTYAAYTEKEESTEEKASGGEEYFSRSTLGEC